MLVYIRQDQRDEILLQDTGEDIPENIQQKFTNEALLLNAMQKELEVHIYCGVVYLLSQEIATVNWVEDGKMEIPSNLIDDEDFQQSQLQRFKIKLHLNTIVEDLRAKISTFTGVDASRV